MTPPTAFVAAADPVFARAPRGRLGVALSGGGDSVALLLLAVDWAARTGGVVEAVTIDHGLRAAAADEAAAALALCARLGVPGALRRWGDWDGGGNLQAAARAARRRLIADWARARDLGAVALGHTLDDQAETFLIRLARGSGVDGLSGMAAETWGDATLWLRPLLDLRRAALRDWLRAEGVPWAEDPSNDDAAFARTRARAALGPLAALGLGAERLATAAAGLARARAALEAATADLAQASLDVGPAGDVTLRPAPFARAPEEIRLRLLAAALCWVGGAAYRPRLAALAPLCAAVGAGRLGAGATLHGCVLRPTRAGVAIRREPAAAAPPMPAPMAETPWDGRWWVAAPDAPPGAVVGALGTDGLARRPNWRAAGLAREALVTTPALRLGDRLLAAPLLDGPCALTARRIAPPATLGGAPIMR